MVEVDDKQARNWGMLCHLTALAAFLGIPSATSSAPWWSG